MRQVGGQRPSGPALASPTSSSASRPAEAPGGRALTPADSGSSLPTSERVCGEAGGGWRQGSRASQSRIGRAPSSVDNRAPIAEARAA